MVQFTTFQQTLSVLHISFFTLPVLFIFITLVPFWLNYRAARVLFSKKDALISIIIMLWVWLSASFFMGLDLKSGGYGGMDSSGIINIYDLATYIIPAIGAALIAYVGYDAFRAYPPRIVASMIMGLLITPYTGIRVVLLYLGLHNFVGEIPVFPSPTLLELLVWLYLLVAIALSAARIPPRFSFIPILFNLLFVAATLMVVYRLPINSSNIWRVLMIKPFSSAF